MRFDDPTLGSAVELSKAIHQRRLSCVAIMNQYLERIEALNPTFNALVSLRNQDTLLAEAHACDTLLTEGKSLGWLHGLPLAPKDLSHAAGLPTTRGSPIYRYAVATQDCLMVARMRAQGGIIIGKSNTAEFGLGSHTTNTLFGATRNAWNPSLSAGGSSGGAAVALALGMLAVTDGSDMMGSLRNPAAWNHVYGLRPTPGLVPNLPAADVFFQQLGVLGPMARTVEDLAALLSVQAGHDPRAPFSSPCDPRVFREPFAPRPGMRIGWLGNYGGHLPIEAPVMRTCQAALRWFEQMGHEVQEVAPFFDLEDAWRAWIVLRSFSLSGSLEAAYSDSGTRSHLSPEAIWEMEHALSLDARAIQNASVTRTRWHHEVVHMLERFDVLVLPSAQVRPFPVSQRWPDSVAGRTMDTYHRWMEVAVPGSLAAVPVINVPAGFDDQGLPTGLQIIANPGQEKLLLDLAYAWQSTVPWRHCHPPVLKNSGLPTGASPPP